MKPNPFWEYLGMESIEEKDGKSVIRLIIKHELTQKRGHVHGGVIASLIDAAVGSAVRSILEENQYGATVEMKLNYIRPASGEKLEAKGEIINKGKTLAVGEAKIFNDEGLLVAAGIATYMLFSTP